MDVQKSVIDLEFVTRSKFDEVESRVDKTSTKMYELVDAVEVNDLRLNRIYPTVCRLEAMMEIKPIHNIPIGYFDTYYGKLYVYRNVGRFRRWVICKILACKYYTMDEVN